ncbi:hypothetical protein D3C87_377280 [compost metagenome]
MNDYGRALYATEITARDVYPKNMDEEEIAAKSGFLGKTQLPWWIRPGIKYRGLWFQMNPNSGGEFEKYYDMQNDVNLALHLDKKQRFVIVGTASYANNITVFDKKNYWYPREYYLRFKYSNNFWVYLGQLDKVFGIRLIDHTAVSRQPIRLGQFSQSQGAVLHWTYPKWDIAVNPFMGNSNEKDEVRQKGGSISGEFEVHENFKVGASALSSESTQEKWSLVAASTRMGLSKGSAIMAEVGLKEFTNKVTNADAILGSYAWVETLINIRRGYNLLSVIEHSRSDLSKSSSESMKWSIGGLLFPLPKTEVRLTVANGKFSTPSGGVPDMWQLQSQIHFAF